MKVSEAALKSVLGACAAWAILSIVAAQGAELQKPGPVPGALVCSNQLGASPSATALYQRAESCYAARSYSAGLRDVNKAIAMAPFADAYALRGKLEEAIGEPKRAVEDYRKALSSMSFAEFMADDETENVVARLRKLGGALPPPPPLDIGGKGSLGLADLKYDFPSNSSSKAKKLWDEVDAELVRQRLNINNVACTGRLIYGKWYSLRLQLVTPFHCDLGARRLTINGKFVLVDAHGHLISEHQPGAQYADGLDIKYVTLSYNWQPSGKPVPLCPDLPKNNSVYSRLPDSDFTPASAFKAIHDLGKYIGQMPGCKGDCYSLETSVDLFIARGAILRLQAIAARPSERAAAVKRYCDFLANAFVRE